MDEIETRIVLRDTTKLAVEIEPEAIRECIRRVLELLSDMNDRIAEMQTDEGVEDENADDE